MENLPKEFVKNMQAQMGNDYSSFALALSEASPVSIRLNPGKPTTGNPPSGDPVMWNPNGLYLAQRPVFTLDPAFHAGAYYVQEASSMVIHEVLNQVSKPKIPLRILDLCAAPGGKSTLLASWMSPESLLVANEVIQDRSGILRENLSRWGHSNTYVCSYDPKQFVQLAGFFDIVLVDAPCSGEGLFRKDQEAIKEWSEAAVELCAARQKRILAEAAKLVAPGGVLIYCTCTYNDVENEANAEWLSAKQGLLPLPLSFPGSWGVTAKSYGFQFYPHKTRGEGFYISAFRQTRGINFRAKSLRHFDNLREATKKHVNAAGAWLEQPEQFMHLTSRDGSILSIPTRHKNDLLQLDDALPKGVWFSDSGELKGTDFIPSHALALSLAVSRSLPTVELDATQSLSYLKKESLVLPDAPRGWAAVRYRGLNLGWIKNIGSRVNNYLPKDYRIRMELPKDR